MEKKDLDWSGLGFGYRQTERRYVANYKDGAWDDGVLTEDANIVLNCSRQGRGSSQSSTRTRAGRTRIWRNLQTRSIR